jgi:hypothetical protein
MLSSNINVPTHCHPDAVDDSLQNPVALNGVVKHLANCSAYLDSKKV